MLILLVKGSARQLEQQRVTFRRAQKTSYPTYYACRCKKESKLSIQDNLNGADIARSEKDTQKELFLFTLRAVIDYAWEEADTTHGKLGVKVWIYRGEVLPARKNTKGGK